MTTAQSYTLVPKPEMGFRCMMSLKTATEHHEEIVRAMDAKWPDGWGICILDGGKMTGSAYGGKIEEGDFYNSDSIGYVVMETYVSGKFELVSKGEPDTVYKTLASMEYAEERQEEIVGAMDTKWPEGWGICLLEGGKVSGSAYGGQIEPLAKFSSDIGFAVMVKWDDSFDIIPVGKIGHKHLMTVEEAQNKHDEIIQSMDSKWPEGWGTCVLDGGKASGSGYGGTIETGDFLESDSIGWAVMTNYY